MPNSAPVLSPLARPGYLVGGKYKLESVIGYGGMGSVWRAKHTTLGQRVAVKVIASIYAGSSDARRRFDMEAKAAAVLRSRHAVQVFDNGEFEDGTPYIVMEHLDGEALDRRIHRGGPLSIDETARVLTHIGRALGSAHQAGIVHRDIKPENIFLALVPEEDDFIAKVLDFGIAKVSATQNSTDTTRTGSMVGTPQYMSPEQARGSKEVDFRSDLYSLGALTYTMLTGNLVFDADTLGEMVLKVCGDPLPKISAAAPWVPADVDDWFHKACARDASQRFLSVTDMVDAFHVAAGLARPKRLPLASRPEFDPEIMIRTAVSDADTDATGQLPKARANVMKQGNPFALRPAPPKAIVSAYDSSSRQSVTPPPSSSTLASARIVPVVPGHAQAADDQEKGINWGFVLATVIVAGGAAMLAIAFLGTPRLRAAAAPSSSPPALVATATSVPAPSAVPVATTPPAAASSAPAVPAAPQPVVQTHRLPAAAATAPPGKTAASVTAEPPPPPAPPAPAEVTGRKPSSALDERF